MKHLNIMVSKHSVFYSPLIGVIAGDFLKENGYEVNYSKVPENETEISSQHVVGLPDRRVA